MANFSVISTSKSNRTVHALISGNLEIRDSANIKTVYLQLIADYDHVEIVFKNIEKIDVSALQLLLALQQSAVKQAKKMQYVFENSDYVTEVLNISGFNNFITA